MSQAAEAAGKPMVLINPKLGDVQSGEALPRVFAGLHESTALRGESCLPTYRHAHAPPCAAGGVMSVRGRQGRMDFVETFKTAYHFRLLCERTWMLGGAHMLPLPSTPPHALPHAFPHSPLQTRA